MIISSIPIIHIIISTLTLLPDKVVYIGIDNNNIRRQKLI